MLSTTTIVLSCSDGHKTLCGENKPKFCASWRTVLAFYLEFECSLWPYYQGAWSLTGCKSQHAIPKWELPVWSRTEDPLQSEIWPGIVACTRCIRRRHSHDREMWACLFLPPRGRVLLCDRGFSCIKGQDRHGMHHSSMGTELGITFITVPLEGPVVLGTVQTHPKFIKVGSASSYWNRRQ